jgi:hypothetical protein
VIGLKEFDHGGDIMYPPNPLIEKFGELYIRLRREFGHEPDSGRRIGDLLFQAGFESIKFAATYESFTHPALMTFAEMSADLIKEDGGDTWAGEFLNRGWATRDDLSQMIDAWQQFANIRGAIFAAAWCEAIGFKAQDPRTLPRV